MFSKFIGKESQPVKNIVEKDKVEQFIKALGDMNPVYFDENFVSPYKKLIAPPTYPRTFEYGEIPGVILPKEGLINGEQSFHYERPIFIGEELFCQWMLTGVERKKTRSGLMTFIELEQWGRDSEGKKVFNARKISIMSEIIRKKVENWDMI